MPLYQLVFLEECKFLSEGSLESIKEFGDYFFSEEGTYLRMYGGTKAPSLLPKYAIDYIVHKEVVRYLFLDGFGSHVFNLKKAVFPPLPFYVGSYKFSRVKNALEFIKELEIFHFGEKIFHRNDSQGKVASHQEILKVNSEYVDHVDKDEEVYRDICNMTSLKKWLKRMMIISGVKCSSSNNIEQKG